jgi:hypothetical protein
VLQRAKLERLMEAAAHAFAVEPKIFKAGRYGFGDTTAELLEEFGFVVDTSVLPFTDLADGHGPSFRDVPDRPFWFGWRRPLLELPVTRNFTGLLRSWGGGRMHAAIDGPVGHSMRLPGLFARFGLLDRLTLTPEGMELRDLCDLTRALIDDGRKIFTLSFHSPSLAPGNTPYVRTEIELDAFLTRLHDYTDFFFRELGGCAMTALEIYESLAASRQSASESMSDGGLRAQDAATAAGTSTIASGDAAPEADRHGSRRERFAEG